MRQKRSDLSDALTPAVFISVEREQQGGVVQAEEAKDTTISPPPDAEITRKSVW